MKNVISKPEPSHPAIESNSHLFDDWFDPIENMTGFQPTGNLTKSLIDLAYFDMLPRPSPTFFREEPEFLARRQLHRLRKNSSGRRRSSPLLRHRRGGEAVLDQAADRFTARLDRVGLTPFTDLNNNWLRQAYGHGRIAAGGWPPASALFAVYRY